ncbi:MAG TPA: bifunctional glutamate N-acetyltransferase/amino-acid acetyltransferase ArgJ [Acidimicrobiales bacterium]|nr:bifunctional glutamate N-acetyltransferase/amino-acid acetyltransferase ArgJ [Acidimicrobiales bacterium]
MSVTAAAGFAAAGVTAGIRAKGGPDLALVATEDRRAVPTAAVFTQNRAAAAPVQVSREHLRLTGGSAAAIVLNAGNANAATGASGMATALGACAAVAGALGCGPHEVLVCSTGLIGIPLELAPFETAVPLAAQELEASNAAGAAAAEAIRTTDTHRKEAVARAGGVTVGGMAKGAAMLAPNMATMLAVLTTDAHVDPATLQKLLEHAVAGSFHRITIDGCTSTNDTVIAMASGRADSAGGVVDATVLGALLDEVCLDLAAQMVGDAEGATKIVTVWVRGAASDEEAARAARRIAESQLVKCSWYGKDPYWGRVVSEAGSAGVTLEMDRVSVAYGAVTVCRDGVEIEHDRTAVAAHMAQRHLEVVVDLGVGDGAHWLLTNDLTHAYVDENMGTS